MATTTEVPVSRPVTQRHPRLLAAVAVGVAILLAVSAALAVIAVAGLASAPGGRPIGPPPTMPNPAPGPFGS